MKTTRTWKRWFISPAFGTRLLTAIVATLWLWPQALSAQVESEEALQVPGVPEAPAAPAAPDEPDVSAAPQTEGPPPAGERVSIGAGLKLGADETASEAVTIFGSSEVAGTVKGEMVTVFGHSKLTGSVGTEMVTVFGDADVNGSVANECVVVFGNLKLGPNAKVGNECVVIFGKVERHPDAQLGQEPIPILPMLSGVGEWITDGLLLGRLIPPGSRIAWIVVGLHLLLYGLIALLLPRPVKACADQLESRALLSFGVGILTMILLTPLYLILAAIGVGIVLIPFIGLAETLLAWLGKTATIEFFGFQVLRGFGRKSAPAPLPRFLIGFVLVTLLYMVPILGLVLWMALRPFALGAAVLSLGALMRRDGNGRPTGVPVAPVPPLSGLAGSSDAAAAQAFAGAGIPPASGATPAQGGPALPPPMQVAVMPRAGFWIRLLATTLDFIALFWILLLPAVDAYFLFFWIAYHIGMWAWKGTTIGGVVCNLKVVRLDGRKADASVCVVRGLAGIFSALPLMLGFFWVGWTSERQSWHDKIAGTVIVRVPRGLSLI